MDDVNYGLRRTIYYVLSLIVGYVFPFVYFFIKLGVTQTATTVVLPTIIAGIFLVIKLAMDIPKWVATWRPTFWKGMIVAIPKLLLFVILITLGAMLQYILKREITLMFYRYYEAVIVLFGGQSVGAILGALHLKYRELHMIQHGYVLGVVNK